MKPLATTRTTMSMPMVMIATTNTGRPTIGRIAMPLDDERDQRPWRAQPADMDTKNENPANATMPIAGAT